MPTQQSKTRPTMLLGILEDEEESDNNDANETIHESNGRNGITLNQLRNLPKSTPTPFQRASGSKSIFKHIQLTVADLFYV